MAAITKRHEQFLRAESVARMGLMRPDRVKAEIVNQAVDRMIEIFNEDRQEALADVGGGGGVDNEAEFLKRARLKKT